MMGKKTRLPGVGTVGRRTILQLSQSPPGLRIGAAGGREETGSGSEDEQDGEAHRFVREKNTDIKPRPVIATEGLSLLGAYDDSDEEESGESSQPPAVKTQHNQSTDIDSTLANFMAEIDAITIQPSSEDPTSSEPAAGSPKPEPDTQKPVPVGAEKNKESTEAEFQYNTEHSLAEVGGLNMGDWQEVWEESSGCYYYWNTMTNEVAWELPHYLADQVQGLQQSANTSAVNGTTHTGYYADQNIAPATPPPSKHEAKTKEVIESVVALTSEEEERRGVAALLLGPLIPSDVKEAEEKWRKTLIGSDEKENSLDSDGGGSGIPGSPLVILQDPDSNLMGQKDAHSSIPSEANSDAEQETEEDTMELELALERKKAELRALEEGDGSAGGSSPCSETSQEAAGPHGLLKKGKWKTAFLRAASPDSSSRGSYTQETTDTADPKVPEKAPPPAIEEKESEQTEDKTELKILGKEEVETPELKFQIGELANTLTSKLEFLGIKEKAISNFQLLLIQTETRIADWREGALNGVFLRRRLQEAAEHIKHYELNATPKGWSCHWDREHRRYFYVNDRTSASQWDFPAEEDNQEETKFSQVPQNETTSQGDAKICVSTAGIAGSSSHVSVAPAAPLPPSASPFWSGSQPPLPDGPPPPPPPPSDYPPPPPPPPTSPPPPPPPPDSDGEIMEVEMEMDDDEGDPPPPGTEEDGSGRPPLPPGIISTKIVESTATQAKGHKRKAGQLTKSITIGSCPIIYTQPAAIAAPVIPIPSTYWGVPPPPVTATAMPVETPVPPVPPFAIQPPLPSPQPPAYEPPGAKTLPVVDKTKKLKKDKSKKTKTKMPSLVMKWQTIQKELDEEEKSSSSDEDRDLLNKKSIEEWKQQQLLTGKAGKNANFEALPIDWRERVKKRKMMNST